MPRSSSVRPYDLLARHYDDVFLPFRVPVERARARILGALLPRIERACDLCCGTGITALDLAGRGIQTWAVDLSPDMCRITRQKARAAKLPIRVLRADMRDFRLPKPVDLITCEADAINHVARHADLAKVAKAVARALRPGGYFYFDVNNLAGFERYWTGILWIEKPDVVLVMRNGNNLPARKAWTDVEWFIRSGRAWQRHRERVEEVCWDAKEIRRVLKANGFDSVHDWDAEPFFKGNALITQGCRSIYLARKSL